jgi:hypothetical protein
MGCNSEYMNPTAAETNSKRVCALLIYVLTALNRAAEIQAVLRHGAANIYGDTGYLNRGVIRLCSLLSNMTQQEQDTIIYDGRNEQARDLADWWDEHQKADNARLAEEAKKKAQRALAKQAKAKLSPAELQAILDEN